MHFFIFKNIIASEIAIAHGDKLDVASTNDETVFTLWMPSVKSSD
ncbi:hypothetical protein ACPPVU_08730 [Mucilaginibacter sp. McL0603]